MPSRARSMHPQVRASLSDVGVQPARRTSGSNSAPVPYSLNPIENDRANETEREYQTAKTSTCS